MDKEILKYELLFNGAYIAPAKHTQVCGILTVDCLFKENGIIYYKRHKITKFFSCGLFGIELNIIQEMTFGNKEKLLQDEVRRINKPKFRKELEETVYELMVKDWQKYFDFSDAIPFEDIKKLL